MRGATAASLAAVPLVALSGAVAPGVALAQAPTQEEYIARADSVCTRSIPKAERLIDRAFELADRGRARATSRAYVRGIRVQIDAIDRIAKLEKPAGDAQTLRRWLAGERRAAKVAVRAAQAIGERRENLAERLFKRANGILRGAVQLVRGYGFDVCAGKDAPP